LRWTLTLDLWIVYKYIPACIISFPGYGIGVEKPIICIVDNDAATREGLRAMLHTLDVEVVVFANAEEFLDTIGTNDPALLIADINLPGLSGVELLEHLNIRQSALPTILLDSVGDVHIAVRAMQAGVIDYIEKPFVDRLLIKRINDVLNLEHD